MDDGGEGGALGASAPVGTSSPPSAAFSGCPPSAASSGAGAGVAVSREGVSPESAPCTASSRAATSSGAGPGARASAVQGCSPTSTPATASSRPAANSGAGTGAGVSTGAAGAGAGAGAGVAAVPPPAVTSSVGVADSAAGAGAGAAGAAPGAPALSPCKSCSRRSMSTDFLPEGLKPRARSSSLSSVTLSSANFCFFGSDSSMPRNPLDAGAGRVRQSSECDDSLGRILHQNWEGSAMNGIKGPPDDGWPPARQLAIFLGRRRRL